MSSLPKVRPIWFWKTFLGKYPLLLIHRPLRPSLPKVWPIWFWKTFPLCAKVEQFSCFHSSCQLELRELHKQQPKIFPDNAISSWLRTKVRFWHLRNQIFLGCGFPSKMKYSWWCDYVSLLIMEKFYFSKKNIPNLYPEQKIWISCRLLWARNSNFLLRIGEVWNIYWEK